MQTLALLSFWKLCNVPKSSSYHRYYSLWFSCLTPITMKKALLWTDGWYFLQAAKKLSDQWNFTRIGEDLAVDVWMADVSHYVFKILSEGKCYEQRKFSEERFIILYLRKFGCLLGVDHSTLSFYWNFLFRLLQFNPKFYLNFSIVATIIYYHSNCSIRIWNWSPILLYTYTI